MKKRLILYFNKKLALKNEADKVYIESYDEKYNKWQKNVEKNENSNRKKHTIENFVVNQAKTVYKI